MKLYTKTGDNGFTSLIGGKRVKKYDLHLEAYGTVDELNSYISLLRSEISDLKIFDFLLEIQRKLFLIGTELASEKKNIFFLENKDLLKLENEIDKIDLEVSALKNFIVPGGNKIISFCHIARCVCRRAERRIIELSDTFFVSEFSLKYINRLSDYLFILSRKLAKDFKIKEIIL